MLKQKGRCDDCDGPECESCGGSPDVSESAELACSTNGGPLTPEQRVDRLFDVNEFPTYNEIVDTINDAEFDAVNFREIVAKRHGMTV